jgi:hypothetical protein
MTEAEAGRSAPRRESVPTRETHADVTPELVRDGRKESPSPKPKCRA